MDNIFAVLFYIFATYLGHKGICINCVRQWATWAKHTYPTALSKHNSKTSPLGEDFFWHVAKEHLISASY